MTIREYLALDITKNDSIESIKDLMISLAALEKMIQIIEQDSNISLDILDKGKPVKNSYKQEMMAFPYQFFRKSSSKEELLARIDMYIGDNYILRESLDKISKNNQITSIFIRSINRLFLLDNDSIESIAFHKSSMFLYPYLDFVSAIKHNRPPLSEDFVTYISNIQLLYQTLKMQKKQMEDVDEDLNDTMESVLSNMDENEISIVGNFLGNILRCVNEDDDTTDRENDYNFYATMGYMSLSTTMDVSDLSIVVTYKDNKKILQSMQNSLHENFHIAKPPVNSKNQLQGILNIHGMQDSKELQDIIERAPKEIMNKKRVVILP